MPSTGQPRALSGYLPRTVAEISPAVGGILPLWAESEHELGDGGPEDRQEQQGDHDGGPRAHLYWSRSPGSPEPGGTSVTPEPACNPQISAADWRSRASEVSP